MTKRVKFDPDNFQKELSLLKNLFQARFPEPKKSINPQVAPRKWPRWLIIYLGRLGASLGFNWHEYTLQLKKIEQILIKFGLLKLQRRHH